MTEPTATPSGAEREPRDPIPATLALLAAWVIVYLLMAWTQGELHARGGNWLSGGIRQPVASRFGSVSVATFREGQVWRAFNATFIHYSLVHLAINGVVFFLLGRIVEPWYGAGVFCWLYALIGAGGNALAMFVRPMLGQSIEMPSGGGSGVICGLIALIAVVGWRERSRQGDFMLAQMGLQLLLVGGMGMVIPHVDNLVHASGAAVGLLLGLFDPLWLRCARRWVSIPLLVLFLAGALGCVWAQVTGNAADERTARQLLEREVVLRRQFVTLLAIDSLYREAAAGPSVVAWPDPAASLARRRQVRRLLGGSIAAADQLAARTGAMPAGDRAAQWRRWAGSALRGRPDPGAVRLFLAYQRLAVGAVQEAIRRNAERFQVLARRLGLQVVAQPRPAAPAPQVLPNQSAQPVRRPASGPPAPKPSGTAP